MVFECEFAVKLHANDVEVWTSANGNPRQDEVTIGRVHSPGSTNVCSLSFGRSQSLVDPQKTLFLEWPHRQGGFLRMLKDAGSIPGSGCTDLYCARRLSGGTANEDGGCDQPIGSTVPDAIVLAGCGRLQL